MDRYRRAADSFLKSYGMGADVDIEKESRAFANEIRRGLLGEAVSLDMTPFFVQAGALPKKPVAVVDIGGTNLRAAKVSFSSEGSPSVDILEVYPTPGSAGEVTKEEFFGRVAASLSPLISVCGSVGICFSFPQRPEGRDARVQRLTKQVKIKGIEGALVGEGVLNALNKSDREKVKSYVVVNDVVATLLSGKINTGGRKFESYIGFILGTGTNSSYIEKSGKKQNRGDMVINLESARYEGFGRGVFDRELDEKTDSPGMNVFEKMVSGRYRGEVLRIAVLHAAKKGLFSKGFCERFSQLGSLQPAEIDEFFNFPYGGGRLALACETPEDRLTLYHMADILCERAAKLIASNLTALLIKSDAGKNPCRPVLITAEGSTFYKSKNLKPKTDYYMKKYAEEKFGCHFEIAGAENAVLAGTALAAV
jgi:hexokinase